MFTHVVLFWLKKDAPNAKQQLLDDARRLLSTIPGMTFFDIGVPAGTDRPVVDNTYDAALVTVFADSAGHDAYQVHAAHQEFIARNKPNFDRIRVFDSI
jgi:hypothetical protein